MLYFGYSFLYKGDSVRFFVKSWVSEKEARGCGIGLPDNHEFSEG